MSKYTFIANRAFVSEDLKYILEISNEYKEGTSLGLQGSIFENGILHQNVKAFLMKFSNGQRLNQERYCDSQSFNYSVFEIVSCNLILFNIKRNNYCAI